MNKLLGEMVTLCRDEEVRCQLYEAKWEKVLCGWMKSCIELITNWQTVIN